MRVEVQVHNLPSPPGLIRDLEKRAGNSFARFQSSIKRVCVHLEDVNGPRGGRDKECRIVCHLAGGASIMLRRVRSSTRSAVITCFKSAQRSVQRHVRREHGSRMVLSP